MAILISHHVLIFFTVNINYIDDDQLITWLGAKDYSQGLFYEPRFYGQAYSTFMEAFVAVPFIWLKMPVYYAVPLATHLIFLTPFLFTAFYLHKNNYQEKAILVLALLLCMPTGFDVMTSIPRGFVTGIFFTLFYVISLLNPKNYKYIFINTLFSCIACLVNPSSILITIPFLFYLFLFNYKDKKYYKYSILALLCAVPFELLLNQFYRSNPENVIYTITNSFNINFFKSVISNLDEHFAHIGLFIENSSMITVLLFLIISIFFFKTNKKWLLSSSLIILMTLGSFFAEKISHGGAWPFFSFSRMFLAFPIFFMCCIVLANFSIQKIKHVIVIVVLLFTVIKEYTYKDKLEMYAQEKNWVDVNLFSLKDILKMSQEYKNYCTERNAKAIIILGWTWGDNIINYAGSALDSDYPKTFKPHFERRRWRIKEELKTTYSDFIIYTRYRDLDSICKKKYKDVNIKRINDWGAFYIYNNKRTTVDFLKYIDAKTVGF